MRLFTESIRAVRPRDVLSQRRAQLRAIALESGARDVLLFGSTARGEDAPFSDLDLLLVGTSPGLGVFRLMAIERKLRDVAQVKVQLLTEGGLTEEMRVRILAEAVPL